MAAVLAKMGGDPVCSGLCRNERRANRIGVIAAARVPDRRDVVDVDAEAEPAAQAAARLPGFTAGMCASSGGNSSGL